MPEKAVVILQVGGKKAIDAEIPLNITANELILALCVSYSLRIPAEDLANCCIKAENPIALLRGDRTLAEFGIHNGTKLLFAARG